MVKIIFHGPNQLFFCFHCRAKFGYAAGTIKAPCLEDPNDQWETDSYLIMSWLVHSIEPDIAIDFLAMDTTQDIWNTLAHTYSRKGNVAQVYELQRSIEIEVQGDRSTIQDYTITFLCSI